MDIIVLSESVAVTSTTRSSNCMKKNLLQRRGSNTSLTLNILGGSKNPLPGACGSTGQNQTHNLYKPQTTQQQQQLHQQLEHDINYQNQHQLALNRFNSHSALNVMSTSSEHRTTAQATKKGLLERRNSNASLTLQLESRSTIQKRALSTSNCYLRSSNLSLSSGNLKETNVCSMCGGGGILRKKRTMQATPAQSNLVSSEFDSMASNSIDLIESIAVNEETATNHEYEPIETTYKNHNGHRKFLSSENLNATNAFSLYPPPMKTTSFVDLNQTAGKLAVSYDETFCPCSGNNTRNITTKPLSPHTTSVDFKMYLANIQILQSAMNILTGPKLETLGIAFDRSYAAVVNMADDCVACETCTFCEKCKLCATKCRCELNRLFTNLHKEFWDLPANQQEKPIVSGSNAKNRYKTVIPNDHSRVVLQPEHEEFATIAQPAAADRSTITSYINANYIKVGYLFAVILLKFGQTANCVFFCFL